MALAKYCEDIVDRYSEDNYEQINALFNGRDFDSEWRLLAANESAAVAAKIGHRFFEDRMAFLRTDRVRFTVECASKTQSVAVVFVRRDGTRNELTPDSSGRYEIKAPKLDGDLELRCGNYSKSYRIAFLDQRKPELLPDVKQALSRLISNPARWTNWGFEKLRNELDAALATPG